MQQNDSGVLTLTSAEALVMYRLVRRDASGNAVYCDAGEYPLGPTYEDIAITTPISVTMLKNKVGTIELMASGAITQFADVFTDDDGKITATNTGVRVGIALVAATADGDVIEVQPDVARVPYVNTAAATAIGASTTDATAIDVTHTVPASELKAGSIIRVKAAGLVVDQDSTPQFDLKLYAGTELIATATVAAAADNDQAIIEAVIVIRSIGTSGTLIAAVKSVIDAAGTAVAVNNKAQATETTAAGLLIYLTGTFDASHADNSFRLDILEVEHIR